MSVFQKLALGGGGVKGVLHIGALQELAKHQPLVFPQGIYGSSIGAVIGTYVAFGLPVNDDMVRLTKKYLSLSSILPKTSVETISNIFSSKGLFDMSVFESSVTQMFLEAGLDIRGKVIGDANMPLYIVTSNITKGIPSILSKNIPVLDALKCSCCLPGLFRPQELYGQLLLGWWTIYTLYICPCSRCAADYAEEAVARKYECKESIKDVSVDIRS
jgi:NTE family protein